MESDAVPEVNEADRLEQEAPLDTPLGVPDPPSRDPEAPEADAIEQSQPSPLTDDDYER